MNQQKYVILIFKRHLLKILFAFELQRTNAMPFTWNGDFSRESVLILAQVARPLKLLEKSIALNFLQTSTRCKGS